MKLMKSKGGLILIILTINIYNADLSFTQLTYIFFWKFCVSQEMAGIYFSFFIISAGSCFFKKRFS